MLCPFTASELTQIAVGEYQLPSGATSRDGFWWVTHAKEPFKAPEWNQAAHIFCCLDGVMDKLSWLLLDLFWW